MGSDPYCQANGTDKSHQDLTSIHSEGENILLAEGGSKIAKTYKRLHDGVDRCHFITEAQPKSDH